MALRLPRRAATWLVTVPARVIFFFFEVAAVSAVSQVGLALPMVVYFHRVGLSGLSANAFIVPILGIAVPIGFVAVFTGWMWVAKFAGWLLGISRAIVAWHAAIEPHWRIPPPPLWLGIAFAAVADRVRDRRAAALAHRHRRGAGRLARPDALASRSRPSSGAANWR